MRIASIPSTNFSNPYIDLFYCALANHGIVHVDEFLFDKQWVLTKMDCFDAVHFHWPETIWRNYSNPWLSWLASSDIRGSWRLSTLISKIFKVALKKQSLSWFSEIVDLLRSHNKKIIWTWHNFEPHENADHFDREAQYFLAQRADLIIFHNKISEKKCRDDYLINCDTVIMPHGNYKGVYPPPDKRDSILRSLGLDDSIPIVGMLGNVRSYKGLDVALDACFLLKGKIQFLCVGRPNSSFNWDYIENKAAKIKYCKLLPEYISDQDFSNYASIMDLILLPYRQVTGSGALMAALTLGRGVVASDLPFFNDILSLNPNAGLLVSPKAQSLAVGIERFLEIPNFQRSQAALELADLYDWDSVVSTVVDKLKQLGS